MSQLHTHCARNLSYESKYSTLKCKDFMLNIQGGRQLPFQFRYASFYGFPSRQLLSLKLDTVCVGICLLMMNETFLFCSKGVILTAHSCNPHFQIEFAFVRIIVVLDIYGFVHTQYLCKFQVWCQAHFPMRCHKDN